MYRRGEDIEGQFAYEPLPSLPDADSPDLISSESYEWDAPANLDDFFLRIYRYYEEKGFTVICMSRILNLLALGFTIAFSAFLLLFVKWSAFKSSCIQDDTCDISEVVLNLHPWKNGFTFWNVSVAIYLAIFMTYWLYNCVHMMLDFWGAARIRHFTTHKLGLSERQLQSVTWPEIAHRIVLAQKTTRLCIVRDLTEHDIVSRIMRKDNYLIGMLNRGVLALHIALPGLRPKFMLTKTLEWNLQWCILDAMFDDAFRIRPDFVNNPQALERRFRRMAVVNLILAPFLLMFLLIYFFLRNAERFYHSPNALGARRWSPLAAWRLREFNELPYYVQHRLNASHKAAERYVSQFPSPLASSIAKFIAFIAGSFAALLLFLALMDDTLLERHLYGRTLVWWAATLGIVLAASRGLIVEPGTAFEPELAMLETFAHTHYLPRHWRGRAHTREVQSQFQTLFQFKAFLFLEEMASILLTPFILYFSLPKSANAITNFVQDFTQYVDGLGDVCSLAAFNLKQHGNLKYGSPHQGPKGQRSKQGKMEKSLVSFMTNYPAWQPDAAAKQLLSTLSNQPLRRTPHFPYTAHIDQLTAGSAAVHNALQTETARGSILTERLPGCREIFASAEVSHVNAASLMGFPTGHMSKSEWQVAGNQELLQSFYEEADRAMRHGESPAQLDNQSEIQPSDNTIHSTGSSSHLSKRHGDRLQTSRELSEGSHGSQIRERIEEQGSPSSQTEDPFKLAHFGDPLQNRSRG